MKVFRDRDNRLILTYWEMNKNEEFYTCDLSTIPKGEDGKIEDCGCTFTTSGKFTYQESGSDLIETSITGEANNRRPQKSVKMIMLEDNTKFCYCLGFDALLTTNTCSGQGDVTSSSARKLIGESIFVSSGIFLDIQDTEKDFYIANPLLNSEPNTISYKKENSNDFINLEFGKYLKIISGETITLKSTLDIHIPKVYY